MKGFRLLLLGVAGAQTFFTNPTEFGDCQACCQEAFAGDNVNINACAQIGCGTVQNCFAEGNQTEQCQNGRDFRFIGVTKIDGTDFSCDANGISEANINFADADDQFFVDEDTCRSCCDDLNDNFDFDNDDVIGRNFCRTTCGSGGRDCLGEGNSKDRLGCSVASDFLIQGSSQFAVNSDKAIVDEPFEIFCLAAGVISLTPDGGNNGGGDDNGNNAGNGNGNGGFQGAALVGLIAGGSVFCLAFIFMAYRRSSNNKSRGSFGQVNLKFGENPASYGDFKVRTDPLVKLDKKPSQNNRNNRLPSNDGNDFNPLASLGPPPTNEKVLRRSPAPQPASNNFGVFTGLHNAVKRLAPGNRETSFNIRVGDQNLTLQPVEANVGRNERGRRVSGLAPPSKKIWSLGGRTKSLFSTVTNYNNRSTIQTDIHGNMNQIQRKKWTPFGATSFNMRVGGGRNVVVPNFTSQKIPVEAAELQKNIAVRGPTQIQQLQTEQFAGGLESTRRLSGQDNFRRKISNDADMGYGLRQQSSNYNANEYDRQGSSSYNYQRNDSGNNAEYGRQESRNQRRRKKRRRDKNESSREDLWD